MSKSKCKCYTKPCCCKPPVKTKKFSDIFNDETIGMVLPSEADPTYKLLWKFAKTLDRFLPEVSDES